MERRVILNEEMVSNAKGEVGTVMSQVMDNGVMRFTVRMDKGNLLHRIPHDKFLDLPERDPIRQEIVQLMDKQFAKGVVKYGATLHENPKNLTTLEMLDYLTEELMDGLHYILKLKRMIREDIERGSRQTPSI